MNSSVVVWKYLISTLIHHHLRKNECVCIPWNAIIPRRKLKSVVKIRILPLFLYLKIINRERKKRGQGLTSKTLYGHKTNPL